MKEIFEGWVYGKFYLVSLLKDSTEIMLRSAKMNLSRAMSSLFLITRMTLSIVP